MTSIEWLFKELTETWYDSSSSKHILEQSKQMHEEEMRLCASFWRNKENEIEKPIFKEYYNKTYTKD